MGLLFSKGFFGSNLETRLSSQVLTKKTYQNENPCKVCEVFQLTKQVWKAFQTYRFWKTLPKEQDFEAYRKQKITKEYAPYQVAQKKYSPLAKHEAIALVLLLKYIFNLNIYF